MQKKLLLSLLLTIASGCQSVQVGNTTECSVAGTMAAGMICAETLTGNLSEMTLEQTIEFLEPQPGASGKPERAGAICRSAEDFNKQKTALEQACRLLGKRCTYDIKETLRNMDYFGAR